MVRLETPVVFGARACAVSLAFLIVLFAEKANAEVFPPANMPAALFDFPISPKQAANEAEAWRERGVDGFVFRGICDSLDSPPPIYDAPGVESALFAELRVAQSRLLNAGIPRNFLYLNLEGYSHHSTELLARNANEIGEFARAAGLQGIALELSEAVPERATTIDHEERARLILNSLLDSHPLADVLLFFDDPDSVTPSWIRFVSGCINALPGNRKLHLVPRALAQVPQPYPLFRMASTLPEHLEPLFPTEMQSRFLAQSATAVSLQIVQTVPSKFRELLLAAKLASREYIHVQANLHDAPPLDLRSQLETTRRIGPHQSQYGAPVYVCHDNAAATVVFWGGLPQPLRIPNRAAYVQTTLVATGHTRAHAPGDGEIVLPPTDSLLLVSNLSMRDWLVAAGIQLTVQQFNSGPTPRSATLALLNGTDTRLDGLLTPWAPEGFSFSGVSYPVHLAPGDAFEVQVPLNGRATLGDAVTLRTTLALEGGGIIETSHPEIVAPRCIFAGVVSDKLIALQPMRLSDRVEVVTASADGQVSCAGVGEKARWTYESPLGIAACAAGKDGIALATTEGITVLSRDGQNEATLPLGTVTAVELFNGEVATLLKDALVLYSLAGEQRIRAEISEIPEHLTIVGTGIEAGMVVAANLLIRGFIYCIDQTGIRWKTELVGRVLSKPIPLGERKILCVSDSELAILELASGKIVARSRHMRAIGRAAAASLQGDQIAIAMNSGVTMLDGSLQPLMHYAEKDVAALAFGEENFGLFAAGFDGQLSMLKANVRTRLTPPLLRVNQPEIKLQSYENLIAVWAGTRYAVYEY